MQRPFDGGMLSPVITSAEHAARLSGILYLAPVVFVLAIIVAFVALMVWASRNDRGDDEGGGDERRGGGGGGHPEPRPPQPEGEPEWWPEFERQFAGHVKARELASRRRRKLTPAR